MTWDNKFCGCKIGNTTCLYKFGGAKNLFLLVNRGFLLLGRYYFKSEVRISVGANPRVCPSFGQTRVSFGRAFGELGEYHLPLRFVRFDPVFSDFFPHHFCVRSFQKCLKISKLPFEVYNKTAQFLA